MILGKKQSKSIGECLQMFLFSSYQDPQEEQSFLRWRVEDTLGPKSARRDLGRASRGASQQ